jgi:hypothetical protein
MGATDRGLLETPYYGCCVVDLYNAARSHASLEGHTPLTFAGGDTPGRAELNHVRWVSHCRDLVQLPEAA